MQRIILLFTSLNEENIFNYKQRVQLFGAITKTNEQIIFD